MHGWCHVGTLSVFRLCLCGQNLGRWFSWEFQLPRVLLHSHSSVSQMPCLRVMWCTSIWVAFRLLKFNIGPNHLSPRSVPTPVDGTVFSLVRPETKETSVLLFCTNRALRISRCCEQTSPSLKGYLWGPLARVDPLVASWLLHSCLQFITPCCSMILKCKSDCLSFAQNASVLHLPSGWSQTPVSSLLSWSGLSQFLPSCG